MRFCLVLTFMAAILSCCVDTLRPDSATLGVSLSDEFVSMMVDNELIVLSTVGASPSITGDVMSAATELITDIRRANPSASDKEVLYLLENDLRRSLDNIDNVLLEQLSSNYTGEKAFPCLEAYKIEVAKIGAQFVVCTTADITQPEGLFECIAKHSIDLVAAKKTFDSCLATTYPNQPGG